MKRDPQEAQPSENPVALIPRFWEGEEEKEKNERWGPGATFICEAVQTSRDQRLCSLGAVFHQEQQLW